MTGRLFIDGTDIYATFGAFVAKGGFRGLIQYPQSKDVEYNDWKEYDGIEPDLSELKLGKKEFQIPITFSAGYEKIQEFYEFLASKTYHNFNFASIGLTRRLRVIGMESLDYANRLSFCKVRLSEDTSPLVGMTFSSFSSTLVGADNSTKIDGVPFSSFGIRLLKGTRSSILTPAKLKQGLEEDISTRDGVITDNTDTPRKKESAEIQLECLLVASTLTEAWNNYYGLLSTLVKKDTSHPATEECLRTLTYSQYGLSIKCFYKESEVEEFFSELGRIWIKFSITLQKV